jgi:hypothetical protein
VNFKGLKIPFMAINKSAKAEKIPQNSFINRNNIDADIKYLGVWLRS